MSDDFRFLRSGHPKLFPPGLVFEVGSGWHGLLSRLARRLSVYSPDAVCVQCKEKFGALRFYAHGLTASGAAAVEVAELESAVSCEKCGEPGYIGPPNDTYLKCLCENHHKEAST
jgi:hypothetical protein